MKADIICISKCMTKKHCRITHAYIIRVRLTEELLKFIAHGHIFERLWYYNSRATMTVFHFHDRSLDGGPPKPTTLVHFHKTDLKQILVDPGQYWTGNRGCTIYNNMLPVAQPGHWYWLGICWRSRVLHTRLCDMSGMNMVLWPGTCPARPDLGYATACCCLSLR